MLPKLTCLALACVMCLTSVAACPGVSATSRTQGVAHPLEPTCVNPGQFGAGAWDPAVGLIYVVPEYFSDSLIVMSAATGRVVGNLPLNYPPDAVAVDPATGDLYVAFGSPWHTVAVFNGTTDAFLTNLTVGGGPDGIAFDSANGDLYVANYNSGNLTVVNGTTLSVVGSIALSTEYFGPMPQSVVFNPWNDEVYVGAMDNLNNLTVVNTTNESVAGTIPVGAEPEDIALADGGQRLFVTDPLSSNVSVINASSASLVGTLALPAGSAPGAIALDPVNQELYIADTGTADVTVVNTSTGFVSGVIPTGDWPDAVVVAANRVLVANFVSNNVTEINPASESVVRSVRASNVFPVEVSETGLPPATSWEMDVNPAGTCGLSQVSSQTNMWFNLPNGSTSFHVPAVSGFVASPGSGSFVVNGSAEETSIAFALPSSPSPTFLGLPEDLGYSLLGGVVGFAVGGVLGALVFRRGGGPRSSEPDGGAQSSD